MMRATGLKIGVLVLGMVLLAGCGEDQAEAPTVRVENVDLGIALSSIPEPMNLESNAGAVITLTPADGRPGILTVAAGEPDIGGVNLVAAVEAHEAELLSREQGVYGGQRELGTQLGTAFYSRGQYSKADGIEEETIIFLVHPFGDRTLEIGYRYPAADDTKVRIEQDLFSVLGELEILPPSADEAGASHAISE